MTGAEIPRDTKGRVLRPRPSQLLADVMEKLGPDHLTTRTLMAALIERDRGAGVEPRAVTPAYGWHIPVLSDPPNVPYDLQELALDIEGTDTGWRNITSLLVNGWAAGSGGYVWLRRTGPTCFLAFNNLAVPATFNQYAIMAPPVGFASSGIFYGSVYNSSSFNHHGIAGVEPTALLRFVGNAATMGYTAGHLMRGSVSYPTDAAWPTTLPGTPV